MADPDAAEENSTCLLLIRPAVVHGGDSCRRRIMSDKILLELKELLEASINGDDAARAALTERIDAYLAAEDYGALRDFFASVHPADSAHILEAYSPEAAWAFIKILDIDSQVKIFNYLPAKFEARMASIMGRRELAVIIGAMSHDERADLFNRLTPEQQEDILPALAHAEREDISKLASYPEGTAGAVMTSDYCAFGPELTAAEALHKLRREAPDRETIYQSYVIDAGRKLLGVVSLRELVMASPQAVVRNIMSDNPIYGRALDKDEDVADIMAKYDLMALPIINGDDKLVGIVTFDDVHDIIEEEATEDFHLMVKSFPERDTWRQPPGCSFKSGFPGCWRWSSLTCSREPASPITRIPFRQWWPWFSSFPFSSPAGVTREPSRQPSWFAPSPWET